MNRPLALTQEQLDHVIDVATPLSPIDRERLLHGLNDRLFGLEDVDDDDVRDALRFVLARISPEAAA